MKLKLHVPKFFKTITPKMIVTWVIVFTALLVVGFGTPAIIFAASPVSYATSINLDDVFYMEYKNENQSKQLFNKNINNHSTPMQTIVNLLDSGSKTNKLSNLFRGNPAKTVENNTTGVNYTSTFNSTYSNNSVTIWFNQPEYSLQNISRTTYKLVDWQAAANNAIYGIMIPLNQTSNHFQSQTLYVVTSNPDKNSSGSSLGISYKISTYGNYYKLWNYINDLYITL